MAYDPHRPVVGLVVPIPGPPSPGEASARLKVDRLESVEQIKRDRDELRSALERRVEDCQKCVEWGFTCAACEDDGALLKRTKAGA